MKSKRFPFTKKGDSSILFNRVLRKVGTIMQKCRFRSSMRSAVLAIGAVTLITFLGGCAKTPKESWAYNYEPDKAILNLWGDGTADLDGERFKSYTKTDDYIELTRSDGSTLKMRYYMDGDTMNLYRKTVYEYQGTGLHEGIIGYWKEKDGRLAFEFTTKGTFLEDTIMPGHYEILDEEQGYVKLMYNDHYYDTYIYCEVDGDTLTVDYPWPMVQTVDEAETNPKGTVHAK